MQNNKVDKLKASITKERLENCKVTIRDNNKNEIQISDENSLYELYLFNEKISKEMRFILSQFEVLLRNNVDRAISKSRGSDWILSLLAQKFWDDKTKGHIERSEEKLKELGKSVNHERILSKMTLGFWVRLFNSPYYESLIKDELKVIFPNIKLASKNGAPPYGIKDIRKSLKYLHEIRNKVNHQEFVLDRKYKIHSNYQSVILFIEMMDQYYYAHFEDSDEFKVRFDELKNYIDKIRIAVSE